MQEQLMAPSAEELTEKKDQTDCDDVEQNLKQLAKHFQRLNGSRTGSVEDFNDQDSTEMQGGVDTARRESFNGPYYNGERSSPQIHRFSPPAFTSFIDLCRDISSLSISNYSEETNGHEKTEEEEQKLDDEDEFLLLYPEEDNKKKTMGRSSSLKSARTSGQKKIVRFADVLGLDLADVHTFLDEVPRIPKSAFKDLKNIDANPVESPKETRPDRTLVPLFLQPGGQQHFVDRLTKSKVCLENAYATTTLGLKIRGTVKVVNLDYHKQVAVRYSGDKWRSFTEIQASYVDTSHDGFSDRFGFTIPIFALDLGQRLEFAIKYQVLGEDHWDNNGGANYSFQCVPEGPPKPITSAYVSSSIALETWGSFY
ncbi:glycogen-binding subunit 76A isoform X2 [Halyomorpha halys]|uniref:glycogen-binding subunit 76A isoform X2 n=1 Tax=Halyomorpha halys TaxID=286706 RepID=UPI0006D50F40|nr:glycogen-binding subunit 76A-like isoform X2 [Halyomorpha halys]